MDYIYSKIKLDCVFENVLIKFEFEISFFNDELEMFDLFDEEW